MKDRYFILSDWMANIRKIPSGLNLLSDWEFDQTLAYPKDKYNRPKLFMVECTNKDNLCFQAAGKTIYEIPVKKIKCSEFYTPAITKKTKGENGYFVQPVVREAIIKDVLVKSREGAL